MKQSSKKELKVIVGWIGIVFALAIVGGILKPVIRELENILQFIGDILIWPFGIFIGLSVLYAIFSVGKWALDSALDKAVDITTTKNGDGKRQKNQGDIQ